MKTRFKTDPLELEMTPMIDIVFNLLIFFVLSAKFRSEEGMIQAFLPKDRGPSTATMTDVFEDVRIKLLWHDADGRPTQGKDGRVVVKIDDRTFNAPGELEALENPELSPMWKDLHERIAELNDAYEGSNPEGLPVIIDARKQIPTKYVISTLNEVVRADVSNVTFAMPELPY